MGLVTTVGQYCYVQCDQRNCNRKMEHIDQALLKDLARLCGWKHNRGRWTCPACAQQSAPKQRSRAREKSLGVGA